MTVLCWWRAFRLGCVFSLFILTAHASEPAPDAGASLSPAERAELKSEYEKLFTEVLRQPTNLDLAFKFAAVAARLGNYEAAISTLERMLLLNRDLPRVKLELGVLYFRIGSYSIARTYFEEAIADPKTPDQVKKNVGLYLAQIDKRTARNHFAGSITAGFRYQTNANVGPSSNQVLAFGVPAILNSTFVSEPDWNPFLSTYMTDSYDLYADRSVTWESTLQGYYAYQLTVHNLNLGFAEVTTGPRFLLTHQQGSELSLHPFAVANVVSLGTSLDFSTFGAGVELDKAFDNDRLLLGAGYTYRYQTFENSAQLPTNSLFTGPVNILGLTSSYQLTDTIQIGLTGYASDQSAQADFNSNWQYSLAAGISKQYAAPFGLTQFPWVANLSLRGIWTDYQAADPTVDPNTVREDRELDVTVGNNFGMTQDLSLLLQAQYTDHNSNIPNYRFTDTSVIMGATWSF
jgi:hypothetical protein